jgi:hypothetical protein
MVLNYTPASTRDNIPPRLPRTRRGGARAGPAGVDLLAEYDSRIHKLLQSTSEVVSGSGESRHV